MHRETEPRVFPASFQVYVGRLEKMLSRDAQERTGRDWVVYRRVGGARLKASAGPGLANTFRRALMAHSPQPVSLAISGHRKDGLRPLTPYTSPTCPCPLSGTPTPTVD